MSEPKPPVFVRTLESIQAPPNCADCRGACCETILLPGTLMMDDDWARVRGFHFVVTQKGTTYGRAWAEGYWELANPCPELTPGGQCAIHATKPQVCRNYVVGGKACLSAIHRRRSPARAHELIGDWKAEMLEEER